jgi:lysozyme
MKRVLPAVVTLSFLVACGPPTPTDELCYGVSMQGLTRVCEGSTTVPGIDVSYYQGTIDFAKVKAAGNKFVIARVSDGTTHPDSKFNTYWPAIRAQGMIRGTYQFFRPGQDALAQANLVLSRVNALGGFKADDLPVVLDIEATDGQSATVVRQKMQIWLNRIEQATGKKPIIYTAAFMSSVIGNGFSSYPLWVANYGATCPAMPSNWSAWKFWQWSSTATVSGISGSVDVNKWNGTLAQLQNFAKPPVVDAGVPRPDAGTADAGTRADAGTADAGTRPDAGTRTDAGTVTPDAGAPEDAGVEPEPDAGIEPEVDAGVDPMTNPLLPDGGIDEGAVLGSGRIDFIQECGPTP